MHDSTSTALLTLPPKQPYRINNCKFQNSMISFLSELHTTKAYTDVTLYAEGKSMGGHRVVLAAGSSYFNNLFKTLTPPRTQTPHPCQATLVVALPNVKYKDLEKVIKFIYLGYLDIVNSELEGFVELAKQLGVVGMADDEEDQPQTEDPAYSQDTTPDDDDTPPDLNPEPPLYTQPETDLTAQKPEPPPVSPPPPPQDDDQERNPTPSKYLQINYTDEDEDLAGYAIEDDEEMDEEDDENSGDYTNNAGEPSSASGNRMYGNNAHEKPFVCLKCGKTYNSNKSLWRHKKFTCDEKIEFKCTVCGKVFSRSDNLRRHVVVAHS